MQAVPGSASATPARQPESAHRPSRDRSADFAQIGVVIPVGPGDRCWRDLTNQLENRAPQMPRRLVFAHGDMQARPRHSRIVWTEARRGRARQQNAGAAAFDTEWLWFLHADSQLSMESLTGLAAFLSAGDDALAYFDLHYSKGGPLLMSLTEWGVRFRCRLAALPFGDQGLLLRRERFYELGAFDESLPYGEDHALVAAAHRLGLPVRRIPAPLCTSARKYVEHGWLATTWQHQRLTWAQFRRERLTP